MKMNRMVAVQDCGLVINPRTGGKPGATAACIMGICAALMEERITDQITGRVLNADMEFYKLAGLADIGEIIVHMEIDPDNDKRGVIGLGEPPAIGGIAAIANAVANAIGVRVPDVPLTPDGYWPPSKGGTRNAKLRIREPGDAAGSVVAARRPAGTEAEVLAGGTDLLSLMKDAVYAPKRLVNIKSIKELAGIGQPRRTACASAPR